MCVYVVHVFYVIQKKDQLRANNKTKNVSAVHVVVEFFLKYAYTTAWITSTLHAMDKDKPHIHICNHLDENGQCKSSHLMPISSQNFTISSDSEKLTIASFCQPIED